MPPAFSPPKPTAQHRLTGVVTSGTPQLGFNIQTSFETWTSSAFTAEITRLPKNYVHLTTVDGEPHVASSDVSKSFVLYLRKQRRLQLIRWMVMETQPGMDLFAIQL